LINNNNKTTTTTKQQQQQNNNLGCIMSEDPKKVEENQEQEVEGDEDENDEIEEDKQKPAEKYGNLKKDKALLKKRGKSQKRFDSADWAMNKQGGKSGQLPAGVKPTTASKLAK